MHRCGLLALSRIHRKEIGQLLLTYLHKYAYDVHNIYKHINI